MGVGQQPAQLLLAAALLAASSLGIRDAVLRSDLLIGAVLVVGARTPALVDRETVSQMKEGSVIVDVDVDSNGVFTPNPTVTPGQPRCAAWRR